MHTRPSLEEQLLHHLSAGRRLRSVAGQEQDGPRRLISLSLSSSMYVCMYKKYRDGSTRKLSSPNTRKDIIYYIFHFCSVSHKREAHAKKSSSVGRNVELDTQLLTFEKKEMKCCWRKRGPSGHPEPGPKIAICQNRKKTK